MTTFDQIVPTIRNLLQSHGDALARLGPLIVNRDLNSRVRLIVGKTTIRDDPEAMALLTTLTQQMTAMLGPHAFPPDRTLLFEEQLESVLDGLPSFTLDGLDGIRVVDRLATETNWASIAPPTTGASRIVFFSIKGGVGRSTALAASAWALAQQGKRVLVLDLDLEAPGLSSALLPNERRLDYGIADWLVEDLVDNGDTVFEQMVATSTLAHDGEIYVVPAHGRDPGEYVAKLGRVWMPKVSIEGRREGWSQRLQRLMNALEQRWQPDVILIDSRAGIDEVASACVTDLGANLVLLFAIHAEQTWTGYRILFRHWRNAGVTRSIRERLQLVGAMIPELDHTIYLERLREEAWDTFTEELYDGVPAGVVAADLWSFDRADEAAPHAPWAVRWHRNWAAVRSLHGRIERVDSTEIDTIFGPLIAGIRAVAANEEAPNP
ncbi:ParA family protein [Candidatus Viridilinea mediisalina]|uniref:CobQ/CobB/MinD/ParA nucleotide binding domain-containing protein n=1 Tax=Candidatus Viridilinea mediisalina TaxID=2024553 RepID=A0A2A6RHU4_9CHLR|nr:AAA family ATPase [Candidatus Viridilinea mediisalina]PDW02513.1 hypothetical protein CJ255_13610 [Candidatus Viridilinea mediisalina]